MPRHWHLANRCTAWTNCGRGQAATVASAEGVAYYSTNSEGSGTAYCTSQVPSLPQRLLHVRCGACEGSADSKGTSSSSCTNSTTRATCQGTTYVPSLW